MSFEGVVQNGVVILEDGQKLPDGTRVEVIVRDDPGKAPTPRDRLTSLAGTVDDLPADMARNHDRYVNGAPTACYDPGFGDYVNKRLDELLALKANWDGYGSSALDPLSIQAARRWMKSLPEHISPRPMVVPLSTGGVRLEWNDGPMSLQLEFESDNEIHYLKWDPDRGMEEEDIFAIDDIDRGVTLIQWFISGSGNA